MPNPRRILVHSCCASCSSYVLEYLSRTFQVTSFYYNPNIRPDAEYDLRLQDMRKVCDWLGIPLITGPYDRRKWDLRAGPYQDLPEKSRRCWECYGLRLEETAKKAAGLGFDLFTTTLSVSPHKIHRKIVEMGGKAATESSIEFLEEDFKKKDGFRISCRRSSEMELSRQDYCGCPASLKEARSRRKHKDPPGT
jgi:predicted adenine nucleotide alpha hydrolase (AANH) superfamily ATPase